MSMTSSGCRCIRCLMAINRQHLETLQVAAKSRRKINVPAMHIHKLKCIWVKGTELLLENGRAAGYTILIWMLVNAGLVIPTVRGKLGGQ